MSALQRFAKMLGIGDHQAEDALRSERAAKVALTRRNLLAAGAALATGAVFSQPTPAGFWVSNPQVYTFEDMEISLGDLVFPRLATFTYALGRGKAHSRPQRIPASGQVVLPGTGITITFPEPFRSET